MRSNDDFNFSCKLKLNTSQVFLHFSVILQIKYQTYVYVCLPLVSIFVSFESDICPMTFSSVLTRK